MMLHKGVFIIGILTIFLMSCKSKKITKSTDDFRERTTEDLASAIQKHNVDYDWFSAKAKIHFQSSYESGRVTIYVIYPFENYYERGTIDEYSTQYGIDLEFEKIQSFLVGNVLIPESANMRSRRIGNEYELLSSYDNYTVKYMVDAVSLILNEHSIIDEYAREVLINFDDYKAADKGRHYSYKRQYYAPIDLNDNASADISISDVEFNVPKSTKFNIPSHYETFN